MPSRFWFVCHFLVAGLSHEILARREKCPAVDRSGREYSISQEAHFPNHCCVLMRRRSLQLLSRPRRCRGFPGFSAAWTFNSNSLMLQPTHHPEILDFQRLPPHRITTQTGKSSHVVLSSHQQQLLPFRREAARHGNILLSRTTVKRSE